MKISRKLAIQILKYCFLHKDFYFPFLVMCREYSPEDDDFVEIEPNEWETISEDENYHTFELWENLQNLYEQTLQLMAKGFIDKITERKISTRYFIFYTTEGFTFQPGSKEELPEIENCQILGWGNGKDAKEAFENFKKENVWLEKFRFDAVVGVELKNQKIYHFNLKK
ncbi:MAG: hypothetical protein UR66_C0014G0004 [Candidatus Moranbacteria bacterium GW2011_GWE1_35_17]|nr:MAG: hypothetical protein UR66_C0014G0004 [Candidatus Moranbacteria bacterium GW2011_GWE1_35_17]KKP81462.1 MAG: hypothetical protein UR82_C0061G0003 [Candidatus Moranbacteria bacterium GW2011_GWF1_35_5]